MSSAPRIHRAVPEPAEVYRTNAPLRVIASIRWATSTGWSPAQDVDAQLLAWTLSAVEIAWTHRGSTHVDWIDAHDVRPTADRPAGT